ncbi:MAG: hypothetical protein QM755_08300 [Luteolibacter sp.]
MTQRATILYAKPPPEYFWTWSDDHSAAEWYDIEDRAKTTGPWPTVALWDELHPLLNFLAKNGGLPPLGSILLVVAACRDNGSSFHSRLARWLLACNPGALDEKKAVLEALLKALGFLHNLPQDLRASQQAKCHLLSMVFENPECRLESELSRSVIAELVNGPGRLTNEESLQDRTSRFLHEAKALLTGLAKLDHASLENLLRTGLEQELQPRPPEITFAAAENRPLLDQLAEMGGEEGLAAAVAKRAIAMVNFPGRFGIPNELPVGGISDITNRGTVDRLLPGELAWDDLVLAARLVHNEALYFRREDPPQDTPLRHTVLLDRGLRLWGRRRVLSLGMALGIAHHPALLRESGTIEVFATLPTSIEPLDLQSKAGVAQALRALVPSAGPENSLEKWLETTASTTGAEDLVFITAREHVESPRCISLLGEIASLLETRAGACRVIVLDREDNVEIQSWSTAGNRVVFRGTLEDQEVQLPPALPAPLPISSRKLPWPHLRPVSPILFPVTPKTNAFIFDPETTGGIGISEDGRLMRWPKAGWGAQEIAASMGGREQWIAANAEGEITVVTSANVPGEQVKVYALYGNRLAEIRIDPPKHPFPRFVTVQDDTILYCFSDLIEAISLPTGHKVAELRGATLPFKPLLGFDGKRISVLGSDDTPNPVSVYWPPKESLLPRLHAPDGISVIRGELRIRCGSSVFRWNNSRLSWDTDEGKDQWPFSPLIAARGGEQGVPIAQLYRMAAEYDPHGILRLRPTGARESVWELLLAQGAASIRHSQRGVFSFEPRLRLPHVAPPPDSILAKFQRFLDHVSK